MIKDDGYSDQKEIDLKSVFEQNWLHARHTENERLLITTIFGAIVAGSLTFISERNSNFFNPSLIPLSLFLFVLSVFSFLGVIKLTLEFHQHIRFAVRIADKTDIGKCMGRPLEWYEKTRMKKPPKVPFSFRWIFFILYSVCIGGFFFWFLYIVFRNFFLCFSIGSILSLISLVGALTYSKRKIDNLDIYIDKNVSEYLSKNSKKIEGG